jgi:Holliday junction resolvasome RuvABC ATP-dependent DNA helicase subunit
MKPTVTHRSLGELVSWHIVPGWSGSKLQIQTTNGLLQLSQMREGDIGPFLHYVEAASAAAPDGMPTSFQHIDGPIGKCVERVDELYQVPKLRHVLDDVPASWLVARELLAALVPVVMSTDYTTHDLSEFLSFLSDNSGKADAALPRAQRLFAVIDEVQEHPEDFASLAALRDQVLGTTASDAWIAATKSVADCVSAVRTHLLPVDAPPSIRAAYDEAASALVAEVRSGGQAASLDELLTELTNLTGIDSVKAEIANLVNLVRVQSMREQHGLKTGSSSRHLVFTGNPGTGKTTVARLVARLYQALGVLPTGQLVEASRTDLVAGYIGQTAIKTAEVFERARGGMLFIDEAYSLSRASGEDYGREAIDTLVKLMEDHRGDTAVIVAGYPEEMAQFIASNPGLSSRFTKVVHFPDYSDDELSEILIQMASEQDYKVDEETVAGIRKLLSNHPRDRGFGNGRLVRQMLEDAVARQAGRLVRMENPSVDALHTLIAEDFTSA